MRPIAVIGGTGRVGGALVARLASTGALVRAGVRDSSSASRLPQGVEPAELDLARVETITPFLAGAERLFLLTPLVPDMVEFTRAVAEALPASGVGHVVRLSTRGADGSSSVTVIRWHGEAETALRKTGVPTTMVRPNAYMQNYLMAAPMIRAQSVFRRNDGQARVSLVDVRDIAAVAASALSEDGHAGRVYDVTGPEGLSNDDVAAIISDVIGSEVRYEPVPDDAARDAMVGNGMPEWLADTMVELHVHRRQGGYDTATSVVADVTGRAPTSFRQFVEDHASAFRAADES